MSEIKTCENVKKSPESEDSSDFLWQREKDSNPHKQSQSLSCYPYTIPLFGYAHKRMDYYTKAGGFVKRKTEIFQKNLQTCCYNGRKQGFRFR